MGWSTCCHRADQWDGARVVTELTSGVAQVLSCDTELTTGVAQVLACDPELTSGVERELACDTTTEYN